MTASPARPHRSRVRVLAMDTSTELGSVAVLESGELRAEVSARVRAKHGETLLPLIEQALAHASLERGAIDLIAVGIGPGSFTGTRIGVATAKGLAIALDRPLIGVVSLTAIARAAPGRWIAPVVDAHKGEVYLSVFERGVERLAPLHAPPAEAAARARAIAGTSRSWSAARACAATPSSRSCSPLHDPRAHLGRAARRRRRARGRRAPPRARPGRSRRARAPLRAPLGR
ncbi:MAG: tRNA (adenosine(37)-N6)-threonylcarbamoyltransferase complex dimerization subunit type 1 TsaB [Sandaracinaceae bacterium]|nr:tRNA (adenosine(37)-N6)-threonylcarbamoyltransferase complex dimerization subunit type 1 TsaB [Sandaracinaceae bacterium]